MQHLGVTLPSNTVIMSANGWKKEKKKGNKKFIFQCYLCSCIDKNTFNRQTGCKLCLVLFYDILHPLQCVSTFSRPPVIQNFGLAGLENFLLCILNTYSRPNYTECSCNATSVSIAT